MYPYTMKQTNQMKHSQNAKALAQKQPTPLRARNQEEAPLSSDQRFYELLLLAWQASLQSEQDYAALLAEEALADAADILHTMEIDEKKHQRILREILFSIYGEEKIPEDIQTEENTEGISEDCAARLEALLLAEMDEVSFYRDLLFAMEESALRDFFYEIITNKQNHTAALNHLYAKYFAKNAGNPA